MHISIISADEYAQFRPRLLPEPEAPIDGKLGPVRIHSLEACEPPGFTDAARCHRNGLIIRGDGWFRSKASLFWIVLGISPIKIHQEFLISGWQFTQVLGGWNKEKKNRQLPEASCLKVLTTALYLPRISLGMLLFGSFAALTISYSLPRVTPSQYQQRMDWWSMAPNGALVNISSDLKAKEHPEPTQKKLQKQSRS